MDSQAQCRTRQVQTRYLAPVEARAAPSYADPRLEELRGEAMRRLFPKSRAGADRRRARVALQLHAYLAEAGTIEDLERRLRVPLRYPMELIDEVRLRDGRAVLVRPVLPSDAPLQRAFVRSMSTATRRNRFHGGVTDLPDAVLRYLTEIDYVDHLALVGEILDESGARQVAEGRWVRRRDEPERADFAIAITDDCQRGGLGNALLDRVQDSAAAKGIGCLCGHVLGSNRRMIGWLEARGWRIEPDADDPGVVCAELPLATRAARQWRAAA
jgi:acetyltransferase